MSLLISTDINKALCCLFSEAREDRNMLTKIDHGLLVGGKSSFCSY